SGYGAFEELDDRNTDHLHELLEDAVRATVAPSDHNGRLLQTFYGGCMDSARAEALGARPLAPELARIEAITDLASLAVEVARLHRRQVGVVFAFTAAPDAMHSGTTIANAGQGGLGLPDRDYYTKTDSASVELRAEYVAHIARMLALAGQPEAAARDAAP